MRHLTCCPSHLVGREVFEHYIEVADAAGLLPSIDYVQKTEQAGFYQTEIESDSEWVDMGMLGFFIPLPKKI